MLLAALHFPPIGHLLEWPDFGPFGFNKIALLSVAAALLTMLLFWAAGRKGALVPTGVQNFVETGVDFVREGIVLQTMGPDGLRYLPFLTSLFFFIFFSNLFEVIPGIQMPTTARMATPALLSLLVFFVYNIIGIVKQGPIHYFKNTLIPPGVPGGLLPIVVLIEFVSNFFIRPFSLAVRLFANMLAGHLLLVTFAALSAALWTKSVVAVVLPLPFLMLVLLTGFEIFVAGLQAFIFTILTAVYIDGARHPHH